MRLKSPGSADSHIIRYRADVDGLRAVAVLAVIAFHLSPTSCPGGYLGVDLFFVISGFLITSIIWREIQAGEFSIRRFYNRRIRRIMPALLMVLLTATPVAAALLLPSDLLGYAKSLLATLAFGANMYFWRDTNYFARTAEDKPLLHLWSLGVEEQFYILFPLLLALLRRWRPARAPAVIAFLTLGSLALNAAALAVGADSTAFFWLPTRAWELGLGAMLALLPARGPRTSIAAGLLGMLGAALMLGSLTWAPAIGIVPAGVPATVGAAMIVLAGRQEWSVVNRVLGAPPLRLIGVVSYSLYLWHWPIIVFAQYYLVRELVPAEAAIAFAVMLIVAAISWRFVERPFRNSSMPMRRVRYAALAACGSLGAAAIVLLAGAGLPQRLGSAAASINAAVGTNYRCPITDFVVLGRSRACLMNLPSRHPADADVILLGNSHAQMYAPLWTSILAERGQTGLLVPANGCLPTLVANITSGCIETARQNLSAVLALPRARVVILGLDWDHGPRGLVDSTGAVVDNQQDAALIAALDVLVSDLERAGKQVILIGPIAVPGWDVPSTISRLMAFGRPLDRPTYVPLAVFYRQFGSAIQHFGERNDIRFVRPDRVQCSSGQCNYLIKGHSLFADNGHIAAAELDLFRGEFEAALPERPLAGKSAPARANAGNWAAELTDDAVRCLANQCFREFEWENGHNLRRAS